jgi:hypothetical protein
MKVIDLGHHYELDCLDEVSGWAEAFSRLVFVKRIGDRYPGNTAPGHSGTTTQEVIRALIDRTIYVDRQVSSWRNGQAIDCLREAFRQLELRAAESRGEPADAVRRILSADEPESEPTCDWCGHIECHTDHQAEER